MGRVGSGTQTGPTSNSATDKRTKKRTDKQTDIVTVCVKPTLMRQRLNKYVYFTISAVIRLSVYIQQVLVRWRMCKKDFHISAPRDLDV